MGLIDSHAHLDFPQFDGDRDAVISRAREAGLTAIVNIGTNLVSSRASVALAEAHSFIYATVGIHPHDAETINQTALGELRALARHRKVVAIGEIGLDYYRDYAPRSTQRRAFADQLTLASTLDLPVVIHSRNAHEDVFAMLSDWEGPGVLHTYAAGPEYLDRVLNMDLSIGISGPVTFSSAESLRETVKMAPLDRLLIETDCPYLTPYPHRGKRNEPAYVKHVAEAIARVREESIDTITGVTSENARRLFELP